MEEQDPLSPKVLEHLYKRFIEREKEIAGANAINLSLEIDYKLRLCLEAKCRDLFDNKPEFTLRKFKNFENAFVAIGSNILFLQNFKEDEWIRHPGSSSKFPKIGRYNRFNIGFKSFLRCLVALEKLGLVSRSKGTRSQYGGRQSRLKATKEFLDSLKVAVAKIDVPSMFKDPGIIEVKDGEVLCESGRKNVIKELQENLNSINSNNGKHRYQLEGKEIPPPILKRVFNSKNLKKGGRFYSVGSKSYMYLNQKELKLRSQITINGNETVELDFKAFHPNILYALNGQDITYDPYEIRGMSTFSRDEIKLAFNTIYNCGGKREAVRAVSSRIGRPFGEAEKIVQDIITRHPLVGEALAGGKVLGHTLMNWDSRVAESVMLRFIKETKGAAILPVHDSFIVEAKFASLLQKIMKSSVRNLLGIDIEVDTK